MHVDCPPIGRPMLRIDKDKKNLPNIIRSASRYFLEVV